MEILKLSASHKEYLWGGQKLNKYYNKNIDADSVAETWELSCHEDGASTITNGKYKNQTLSYYIEKEHKKPLGTNCERFEAFPLLIKFIDAKEPLSLQVHPNDNYALKNENQYGKTEVWYVLDCEPNASLYYGFKREVTKEEFQEAVDKGILEELLNKVEVKKGDVFFIEAGTIHAIGGGITIAEIQQNSNVTYRVYDYNRVGTDGKLRELHIDKAKQVINFNFTGQQYHFGNHLASCNIFEVDKLKVEQKVTLYADNTSFHSLVILDGEGYASASALIEQAKEAAEANQESELYTMCQGDLNNMNGKIPFDAAKSGDAVALQVIDNYTSYLSEGIADMINIFRPEAVLIGGGISRQKDYLIDSIKEKVIPNIFGGENSYIPTIACAKLGNDAGMIGAANLE